VTSMIRTRRHGLGQWFPTLFDAFPLLLILELFIPPLLHESAGIFDLPIYSFSPDFYLSRCGLLFGFVD